jgi:hypothetical protein
MTTKLQGITGASLPPGVPNTSTKQQINTCKTIFPSEQLYNIALPPINRVSYNADSGSLHVNTFFLVDAALIEEHANDILFTVYQLYCISDVGEPQLQFYVTANYTNGKTNEYYSVQVDFYVTNDSLTGSGVLVQDITSVQTFLWNVDPRTSRGTVTTVLSATS